VANTIRTVRISTAEQVPKITILSLLLMDVFFSQIFIAPPLFFYFQGQGQEPGIKLDAGETRGFQIDDEPQPLPYGDQLYGTAVVRKGRGIPHRNNP